MRQHDLWRWVIAVVLGAAIGTALVLRDRIDMATLASWVAAARWAGPLVFVAAYAMATLLFLPGSVLTLAGGALFGPFWGTLWNLTGATLGAALAFLVARYLAGGWVERRIGGSLQRLRDGVEAEGWRFVAFARLVPLFPFNLLNYALGLTRIRFAAYVIATGVFMLPGAVAYTWLGHAGRAAVAGGDGMIRDVLVALSLLAAVAFLPRLVAHLRAKPMLDVTALKEKLDGGADLLLLDVRTASDFLGEQGHIAVACNLPLEELPERIAELEAHLERPIALICRTDRRSGQAARLLAQAGFADVRVVRGGMTAWRERSWPVE